jgi:RNA polymerase sigma factor for flagellar operon FliA
MGMAESELADMRSNSEPLRFEAIDDAYSDSDMAYADDSPDAFNLLADEEVREALADAIASLPERLKLVTQLYFVEELNLAEIAAVLEVSIPRVHQLKAQALAKLKEAMEGVAEVL